MLIMPRYHWTFLDMVILFATSNKSPSLDIPTANLFSHGKILSLEETLLGWSSQILCVQDWMNFNLMLAPPYILTGNLI